MRRSTLLRELASVLDQYVPQLEEASLHYWAYHLKRDIEHLKDNVNVFQQGEQLTPTGDTDG